MPVCLTPSTSSTVKEKKRRNMRGERKTEVTRPPVRPRIDKASCIQDSHHANLTNILEGLQNRAACFILRGYSHTSSVTASDIQLLTSLVPSRNRATTYRRAYRDSCRIRRRPLQIPMLRAMKNDAAEVMMRTSFIPGAICRLSRHRSCTDRCWLSRNLGLV